MIDIDVLEAFASASLNAPTRRPNSKKISRLVRLWWRDATQEQKEDKNLVWMNSTHGIYCFLPLTEADAKELWLDNQYHAREMLKYILEHYDINTYNKVTNAYKDEFERYGVQTKCCDVDGQCNLLCPYYRGGCRYEEVLDAVVGGM